MSRSQTKKHTTVPDSSVRCPFRKLLIITATVLEHAIKHSANINRGGNHKKTTTTKEKRLMPMVSIAKEGVL
jgi:hypothetical protein